MTLENIRKEYLELVKTIKDEKELYDLRVKFLGKKGALTEVMKGARDLSPEERPTFGKLVNEVKTFINDSLEEKKAELAKAALELKLASEDIDVTLPSKKVELGGINPLNKIIEECWKKGFTKTKRLKNSDKVGNYVIAYLTNLEIDDNHNSKKYVKGARLYLYPKGVRIYRCSRGIKKPIEITATKGEVMTINGPDIDLDANYSKKTSHIISTGDEISYITEFYNIGEKNEDS